MLEGLHPKLKHVRLGICLFVFFLLLTGDIFNVSVAHADTFPNPISGGGPVRNPDGTIALPPTGGSGESGGGGTGSGTPGGGGGSGTPAGEGTPATDTTNPPPPAPAPAVTSSSCFSSPGGVMNCIVVTGLGGLTAAFGWAFDQSIKLFIVEFGQIYKTSGLGNTVENLWTTVRDVFNLTFIFGLVYIGFQIILGVNESGARRTIPYLVIAALLVNFSLFITKFIIDFANLAAVQIFSLFQNAGARSINAAPGSTEVEGAFLASGGNVSIALGFMNQLGVSALLNYDVTDESPFLYLLGVGVVFIIMIYVFAVGAVLVSIRFAVLIFYMIFSPLMFLGWVFPGFSDIQRKFWNGLFGQAFFAPAFIFMLYVTYMLTVNFNGPGRESLQNLSSTQDAGVTEEFAKILPYFILIVVFLLGSLSIARKMANSGSSMVMKMNDWAVGKTRGALIGTAGAVGGAVGAGGYKGIDKMANSNNRALSLMGKTLTYAGVRDAGEKAYKGSIQGKMAVTREKRTREMASRGADANAKRSIKNYANAPGAELESAVRGASNGQIIEVLRDYKANSPEYTNIVNALTHEQRKKILDSKDEEFSASEKNSLGGIAVTRIKTNVGDVGQGSSSTLGTGMARADEIAKLTPKEIDILGNKWISNNIHLLTNSQVEKLASDSTVLGEAEKSQLKKTWGTRVELVQPSDFASIMDNRSAKDVAALPAKVLTHADAAPFLTDKVLRAVAESNMTAADRSTIQTNMLSGSANTSGKDYLTRLKNNHRDTNW